MLPLALRLDHHAHVLALLEGADGVDRRGEVDHVEAAAQVLRQRGLEEVDDDVLALRRGCRCRWWCRSGRPPRGPRRARPRRKSMSRTACSRRRGPRRSAPPGRRGAASATAGGVSVTTSVRPSSAASCTTERRRLSTRRVRSAPCTTFMLRSSPWPMSWLARPSALAVLGKSNAMRAGVATAKLGGTLRSGSLVVIFTTTLPACSVTSNPSIALLCAAASPMPASHSSDAAQDLDRLWFIFLPPPVAARWRARPIPLPVLHQLLQIDLRLVDRR